MYLNFGAQKLPNVLKLNMLADISRRYSLGHRIGAPEGPSPPLPLLHRIRKTGDPRAH